MMKINAKHWLVIFTLLLQFSCKDWLELSPYSGLTREEYWQTKEDVESVVMGAYAKLAGMDGTLWKLGEIRADFVTGGGNQSYEERMIMEGSIYPDNKFTSWKSFYEVIDICNEVIHFAPAVQGRDKTFNDYIMDGYLSEAYFIRSLCYFYLVRTYKDVPMVLEPTLSDASDIYPAKTNGDTILNRMISDLLMVRDWATIDGYKTMTENKGRATKGSINALLADIALWQFKYQDCIDYCNAVFATGVYELLPAQRWFELYYDGNSLEGIYELQFDENRGISNGLYGMFLQTADNYWPSDHAMEVFDKEKSGEITRRLGSVTKYSEDEYGIFKYMGTADDGESVRSGYESNNANLIVYRLADVYLMEAEALSQLSRYTEALDLINVISNRAGMGDIKTPAATPADYEDAILKERGAEFAFEGKRWFDVLRMGRRDNFKRKKVLVDIMVTNATSTQKRILQTKLTNPNSWYLPIFEGEMERNKNLVQNPYYKN